MNAAIDEDFSEMHEPHWVLRGAFQLLVFGLVFTEVMLALTVHRGLIWLAVPLVLVASHLMHGALIGLHEAAHGLLRKNRRFNEFDGRRDRHVEPDEFQSLSRRPSNASCLSRDGARLRILATLPNDHAAMEEMSGRIFRAEFRIVLFAVCFPASLPSVLLLRSEASAFAGAFGRNWR